MLYLRSTLFNISITLATVLFGVFGHLTILLPWRRRYRFFRFWALYNLWMLERLCGLRYEVTGLENIPSRNSIVLCKHQSTWETLAMQAIFPDQVWLLKRELLRIPFFGWGMALLEPIAIDRSAGRKALKQLVGEGTQRLEDGRWVVVFPEGTRVAPGTMGEFHVGGAYLASKAGVPVVPVAHNAGEFWPRHGFLKRPGTIRVVIGTPIEGMGRKAEAINSEAREWMTAAMEKITASR